ACNRTCTSCCPMFGCVQCPSRMRFTTGPTADVKPAAPETQRPEHSANRAGAPVGLPMFLRSTPDAAEQQAQRLGTGEQPIAPANGGAVAASKPAGDGQPLPENIRRDFQPSVGADLGQVRIHSGPAAAQMARGYGARAYALGRDIVFGANQFAPDSAAG